MADLDYSMTGREQNVRIRKRITEYGGKVPTPAEAAQHAIDMIEDRVEDRSWDQGVWIEYDDCGTACCVAGDVALQTGIATVSDDEWAESEVAEYHASVAARAILDVTHEQAEYLFAGHRSKDEVLACLEQIVNGTVPDRAWDLGIHD